MDPVDNPDVCRVSRCPIDKGQFQKEVSKDRWKCFNIKGLDSQVFKGRGKCLK